VYKVFRGCASAVLLLLLATPSPAQERLRPLEPGALLPQAEVLTNSSSQPSTSFEVNYHDGQLMIQAQNATLADVLQAIAEKTGAVIDIPPESGRDRIFEKAGPGPADDVLSRLLNGSTFDYIIVKSPDRPHVPTRVVLLSRSAAPLSIEPRTVASAPSRSQPRLYGAGFKVNPRDENSSSPEAPVPTLASENPTAQGDVIPGAVLDQMQKERLRQRQLQFQQQAPPTPAQ
jgi:hypothetical protein